MEYGSSIYSQVRTPAASDTAAAAFSCALFGNAWNPNLYQTRDEPTLTSICRTGCPQEWHAGNAQQIKYSKRPRQATRQNLTYPKLTGVVMLLYRAIGMQPDTGRACHTTVSEPELDRVVERLHAALHATGTVALYRFRIRKDEGLATRRGKRNTHE